MKQCDDWNFHENNLEAEKVCEGTDETGLTRS